MLNEPLKRGDQKEVGGSFVGSPSYSCNTRAVSGNISRTNLNLANINNKIDWQLGLGPQVVAEEERRKTQVA